MIEEASELFKEFCLSELRENIDVHFLTGTIEGDKVQWATYSIKDSANLFWKQFQNGCEEDLIRQMLLKKAIKKGFRFNQEPVVLVNEVFTEFNKENSN